MCAKRWNYSKAHLISTSRHPESVHLSMPTLKDSEALSGNMNMQTNRIKYSPMIINISYTLNVSIGHTSYVGIIRMNLMLLNLPGLGL